MTDSENILGTAAAWLDEGESVALATVVQTWGSSPRQAGSQMAVTKAGRMAGSVSGGCIEGAVAEAGLTTLETGSPQTLSFGVTNERAWDVGLACGGQVKVFVESVTPLMLQPVLAARRAGHAVVLATRLADGHHCLLPDEPAVQALQDAASLALSRDESRLAEIAGEDWFLQVHAPAFRLIVVGAVHIAQSLAPLAAALGMKVTIVDPRGSFASADRFPGVSLSHLWPDEAIDALAPDARTAIVTLTHDPKLDDPALDRALHSRAYCVGALGSRKTHAARLERLAALGHSPASLARIRGPVGLALGAVTAAEIALSIVAEMVAVRRGAALAQR